MRPPSRRRSSRHHFMRLARDCACVVLGVALQQLLGPYLSSWLQGSKKGAADHQQHPSTHALGEEAPTDHKQHPAANGHVVPEPSGDSAAPPAPLQPHGLVLDRPLVTFDLETTGLDVGRDRIVEIAAVKLLPSGEVGDRDSSSVQQPLHPAATAPACRHRADKQCQVATVQHLQHSSRMSTQPHVTGPWQLPVMGSFADADQAWCAIAPQAS